MRPSRDERVRQRFELRSVWWDRIYQETSLQARILRRRQQVALCWVEALSLPRGSMVLEVGCGAGVTAVELARRGHRVYALDRSQAMIRLTQARAMTSSVEDMVIPVVGDTQRLSFRGKTFDLVTALGVLSWLQEPGVAIDELARVTRPGGHVLVTALNSLDVARLLDPRRSPLWRPIRSAVRVAASGLGRSLPTRVRPTRHPGWSVRWRLRRSGLIPVRQTTVGFGSFTFLGRALLSDHYAVRTDEVLQRLADRDRRPVRSSGRLYLVLARKPELA
jgi:ubiquinone/menaquinone biosynthesis C-methylase UbiE